jgi:hypothetical protein
MDSDLFLWDVIEDDSEGEALAAEVVFEATPAEALLADEALLDAMELSLAEGPGLADEAPGPDLGQAAPEVPPQAAAGGTGAIMAPPSWRPRGTPFQKESTGFALFGHNLFGHAIEPPAGGKLAERFTVPPFTVLNAREGVWQDRKRAWMSLGIQSEVGRAGHIVKNAHDGGNLGDWMAAHKPRALLGNSAGNSAEQAADLAERYGLPEDALANGGQGVYTTATSIFDPVLCELAYRWFCPPGGVILDPFAGGSVRGLVAAKLGYAYTGIDLRPEQVAANEEQASRISVGDAQAPRWAVGDSRQAASLVPWVTRADFIFSCPPYADLEEYSDDPRDLSAMEYPAFCEAYRQVIGAALALLRPDRFACFVVGDVRDPKGYYRGLPELTVAAFESAGARKYNEAILVTSVGSLPIRSGKIFDSGRKMGKAHQNVLVFCKGNPKAAAEACNGQLELPA